MLWANSWGPCWAPSWPRDSLFFSPPLLLFFSPAILFFFLARAWPLVPGRWAPNGPPDDRLAAPRGKMKKALWNNYWPGLRAARPAAWPPAHGPPPGIQPVACWPPSCWPPDPQQKAGFLGMGPFPFSIARAIAPHVAARDSFLGPPLFW